MVEIVVYDDPLNPHGWGFEPVLRRLRVECSSASWRWQPVVLVSDWASYDGPEFPRGRQMVPSTCSRVSEESGMPIDEYLWFEDPPSSSLPMCVGVVTATDAASDARPRLFRAAREATFLRQQNLDTMPAVRDLVASVLGSDAVNATPETLEGTAWGEEYAVLANGGPGISDVEGIDIVGGRPELPSVVVRDGDTEFGLSGRVDIASLRELVATVTGQRPSPTTLGLREVIDRFSSEGWLSRTELVALTDYQYRAVMDAVDDLTDVETAEFAAETFVRATEY